MGLLAAVIRNNLVHLHCSLVLSFPQACASGVKAFLGNIGNVSEANQNVDFN